MHPLKHIRSHILKLSQAEFAALASTSQATVSRWEKGELSPDREQMAAIRGSAIERGFQWDDALFFEIPLDPAPSNKESAA